MSFQCEMPDHFSDDEELLAVLRSARTIAVVGASPKPVRDSHRVTNYLIEQGFDVYPVNPGQEEILGRTCYPNLAAVPVKVDIVDVFINPERVEPIVDEAIAVGAKAVWMQLGIIHNPAAQKARDAGLAVVMNRCLMVEHGRLKIKF
ncbi:MAG: CoA-binding protein [Deltaproteobacteria bacterium]|nr:CoA-binding protein [Deltaproteobacteria bacterium]